MNEWINNFKSVEHLKNSSVFQCPICVLSLGLLSLTGELLVPAWRFPLPFWWWDVIRLFICWNTQLSTEQGITPLPLPTWGRLPTWVPGVGVGVECRPFSMSMRSYWWGEVMDLHTVLTGMSRINQMVRTTNQPFHLSPDSTAISLALFMGRSVLFRTPQQCLMMITGIDWCIDSTENTLNVQYWYLFLY